MKIKFFEIPSIPPQRIRNDVKTSHQLSKCKSLSFLSFKAKTMQARPISPQKARPRARNPNLTRLSVNALKSFF